jgi:CPA2 family monovalent cation:H+ antiporter-2
MLAPGTRPDPRLSLDLLRDLVLIYALAVAVAGAFHRLRVPALVGFLITGVLVGPNALGWVHGERQVELLAEVGVVLLLFAIGIEFSLEGIRRIRRLVLLGGGLQVGLTTALVAGFAGAVGVGWRSAVFLGMLMALSSTAIVLKLLTDRAEVSSPHGKVSLGVLIFQDLCVVPMMLAVPFLAGSAADWRQLLAALGKTAVVITGAVAAARYGVPFLLRQAVATRSRELFLLTVILVCLGAAWATHQAGLSLALGAFLAGLVISKSEYSVQALGEILPFRDALTSLFFVSIGMLLDLRTVAGQPLLVAGWVAGILALKALVAAGVARLLGWPVRVAILSGLMLSQVGEFSFVLSGAAAGTGLLDAGLSQLFLASAVATMALAPFLSLPAPRLAEAAARLLGGLPAAEEERTGAADLRDHVVVVGFGLNGRNLARVLRGTGIPYVIVEMNPETVRAESTGGEPIHYGDAARPEVLAHARVETARALVAAISDPAATRRVVEMARRMNPRLHLLVRTRYVQEVNALFELGADEVIPEEFETSVEIFARVLHLYLIPRDRIEACVAEIRKEGYEMLRGGAARSERVPVLDRFLSGAALDVVRVEPGSPIAGRTLAEAALRSTSGVTVLGIRRGEAFQANPAAGDRFEPGDHVLLLGDSDLLAVAAARFRPARPG